MVLLAHWPLAGDPGAVEDGQTAPDIAGGGSGAHDGVFELSASEPLQPWGVGNVHMLCTSGSSGYVHTVSNLSDLTSLQGTMTVMAWWRKGEGSSVGDGAYLVACGGNGETSDLNYQWMLEARAGGAFRLYWENGAGVDVSVQSVGGLVGNDGGWHHIAAVRYQISPGFFGVKFYVNGFLADTQDNGGPGYAAPDGGSNAVVYLGRRAEGEPSRTFGLDSVRVYDSDESANVATIYGTEQTDHEPVYALQFLDIQQASGEVGVPVDVSPVRSSATPHIGLQVFQGAQNLRENAGFSAARV